MNIAKEGVQNVLNNMPDECDIEDLHYRLYALEKIKRGEEAIEKGDTDTPDKSETECRRNGRVNR